MSIKLGDFVAHLKRTSRYGVVATTNDTPTSDILTSINKRLAAIWGRHDYKWGRELLAFDLVAGQRQYDVTAASGNPIDRIQDLIPYDSTGTFLNGEPLTQRTTRDFFKRHGAAWGSDANLGLEPGQAAEYYQVELTAANVRTVVIWPTPSAAGKMGGYAKGILTTYTLADVVANATIAYFPNDVVLDALFSGCMIDIALIQGMSVENSFALERGFEHKISRLVEDQAGVAQDNTPITTRMPATVRRLRSRRTRR